MFDPALFMPVLVQVVMTAALAIVTASMRWLSATRREVHVRDIALGQKSWPDRVQKVSNALNNQWETPTLFYAGVAFAMIAGQTGGALVALAWAYVVFRIAHAAVYVTSNYIPLRFVMFVLGFVALTAFWVGLALRVLGSG